MAIDLETLRKDVQDFLEASEMPVIFGQRQSYDTSTEVSWDVERHPDFREFVAAGRKAGAKLIVFCQRSFTLDLIDEALDQLEDSPLTREEKRGFEARLKRLQAYEGFTSSLELSFSIDGQLYVFEQHTEWYESMNQILDELEGVAQVEEESGENDSLGGYFSRN